MGSHSLLLGISLTQGWNPHLLCNQQRLETLAAMIKEGTSETLQCIRREFKQHAHMPTIRKAKMNLQTEAKLASSFRAITNYHGHDLSPGLTIPMDKNYLHHCGLSGESSRVARSL